MPSWKITELWEIIELDLIKTFGEETRCVAVPLRRQWPDDGTYIREYKFRRRVKLLQQKPDYFDISPRFIEFPHWCRGIEIMYAERCFTRCTWEVEIPVDTIKVNMIAGIDLVHVTL